MRINGGYFVVHGRRAGSAVDNRRRRAHRGSGESRSRAGALHKNAATILESEIGAESQSGGSRADAPGGILIDVDRRIVAATGRHVGRDIAPGNRPLEALRAVPLVILI